MKLIIKEYLSSLRERDELDAVLPDLLSQLGLNVYSRPGRGTRQDGVDVGAVGKLDGEPEKVYLFTIKAGDLTRKSWNDGTPQAVRPSLEEIQDVYIPNKLPNEHRDKDVVICVCFGGDMQEQARGPWEGYVKQHTGGKLSFQELNGDRLAHLIQSNFLGEDLLPEHARSELRKALALLDEPDASYQHFAALITSLRARASSDHSQRVTAIRQMSICLWILFAWARKARNTESAYRSSEFTLLHAWNIVREYAGKKTKTTRAIETAFLSIFSAYGQAYREFLRTNAFPHVGKLHAISQATQGLSSVDVNLKLFDLLGRLGGAGLWSYYHLSQCPEEDTATREALRDDLQAHADATRSLINNNPALLLPAKDDHAIDIFVAVWLLALDPRNGAFLASWLAEIMNRARFAYEANLRYPSALPSYT